MKWILWTIRCFEIFERLQVSSRPDKRRSEIESALQEQGKSDGRLSAKLAAASTLAELEDLYCPFRPKRRTRATIAKEKGLSRRALQLLDAE